MRIEAIIFRKFFHSTHLSEALFKNVDGRYTEEAAFNLKSLEGSAIYTK